MFGYSPLEFRETLQMLVEGEVDTSPLITGAVGLDGVDAAFTALGGVGGVDGVGGVGGSKSHAKILIDPVSTAAEPATPTR